MNFQVNGANGIYDNRIADESVKYGRNAVDNNFKYMEAPLINDKHNPAPILDFMPGSEDTNAQKLENFIKTNDEYLNSLPPLDYEYRYMPNFVNGNINKKALYAAAYEQMGTKEISVNEFETKYIADDSMTAEPLDINKDGKIDVAEYGANIMASDILSKGTTDVTKADGSVNSKGMNAILEYTKKANAAAASKLYSNIYSTYSLGSDLSEFNPQ